MSKRRNIGVITGNLEAPHSYELVQSMNRAARDFNANLLVFPGMHSKSFYEKRLLGTKEDYDYQFNTVYDFVEKEEIDFLLISLGTVIDFLGSERAEEFLAKFNNIPSIVLEDRGFDKTCVVLDNRTGLTKCMEHLIKDHGYKKIAFVTGRKSNFDAKERLDVYLSVMSKYKIPIEEGMIAYGDFTEYSDEVVAGILDNHPDTEAICFANDMMALGAYRECKKRGLVIGRDIAITGFDDIPNAVSVSPPLTTVRVKPYRIGYQAVSMAIDILDGKPCGSRVLGSEFVERESCGCPCKTSGIHDDNRKEDQKKWIQSMKSFLIGESFHHSESEDRGIHLCHKIYDIVDIVADVFIGNGKRQDVSDELMQTLQYLLLKEHVEFFSLDKLEYAFRYFFEEVSQRTRNNILQKELSRLATAFCQMIRTTAHNESSRLVKRYKKEAWYSTYIVQDAMIYSLNEKEALYQIVDKMRMLHFKRAYIFLFKEPIVNFNNKYWICPDKVYLAAKQDQNGIVSYETDERPYLTLKESIAQAGIDQERYMAMHFNLFANETQYGLLFCEAELQDASFAYTISLQIGTALKYLHLTREQMKMQKRLEASLELISRKNDLLNHLSISDELTGLLNRRGVFESMLDKIADHTGCLAAVIYADMDNLKQINDTFGHQEGDYSLKGIANALKKSLRIQDAVGRIGGDEFIAFTIVDEPNLIPNFKINLERELEKLNSNQDKPYFIDLSVGIKELICYPNIDLKDILKEADEVLYADKRNKKKSCLKAERA